MIVVYWFVFGVGLRAVAVQDVPFIVWLLAGLCHWFMFAELISESTVAITSAPFLIKKYNFPSQILPLVKLAAATFNHAIFLCLFILICLFNKIYPAVSWLLFFYYYFYMVVLALGLAWLLAALQVFVRDCQHVVALLLQILFWFTPIVWNSQIMPQNIQKYLALNPMFYVVQGYRDAFLFQRLSIECSIQDFFYWFVALAVLLFGRYVFFRLKPHFADLL